VKCSTSLLTGTSNTSLALGGGVAIAALSAALIAADPEKRRQEQMKMTSGDELEAVSGPGDYGRSEAGGLGAGCVYRKGI
jgi:hypothetical protein